jgi:hypothetical protein
MVNKRGGQPANRNALKHGGYLQRVDGRTRMGKAQRQVEGALVMALGGDPSPQQVLILQRTAVKAIKCWVLEKQLLTRKRSAPTLENHYLRWSRELREDLKCLGLERRAKDAVDIKTWIQTRNESS